MYVRGVDEIDSTMYELSKQMRNKWETPDRASYWATDDRRTEVGGKPTGNWRGARESE